VKGAASACISKQRNQQGKKVKDSGKLPETIEEEKFHKGQGKRQEGTTRVSRKRQRSTIRENKSVLIGRGGGGSQRRTSA